MPTNAGVPITALPAGAQNQWDWVDAGAAGSVGGAQQSALMRGNPGALSWWMQRWIPQQATVPQGVPMYLQSRP